MKKNSLLMALAIITSSSTYAGVGDLLLTEIKVRPAGGEFIEIYNNGAETVDLSNVYITDATSIIDACNSSSPSTPQYYYNIVTGSNFGGGSSSDSDFHAKFPPGSMITAGTYITIAIEGSENFFNAFGVDATYELKDDGGTHNAIEMDQVQTGSISNTATLSNGGETVILYYWDGVSPTVKDIDYVVWGDKCEAVDKTGVSTYANDISVGAQEILIGSSFNSHPSGLSWQRTDLTEGTEIKTGGNGFTGNNEMSENFSSTWTEINAPTPNAAGAQVVIPPIVINEVDAVSSAEFIELYDGGAGNTSLDNVKVAFYDGASDTIYSVIDLTGNSTDGNGYFLIGHSSLTPNLAIPSDSLQDGADAVAVYFTSVFLSNGSPVTTTDILDAFVYDSGQADDAGLLALLNNGQSQINENSNGTASGHSSARCPNGSGGQLNTASYLQVTPTPGVANSLCPVGDYYQAVNPTVENNPALLRSTLHDIIDNHNSGSYSFAWVILSEADEDPVNSNAVRMVYSNETFNWNGGGVQLYNREHTWPQSYGFSDSTFGENNAARTDAHHLMLSNVNYNSLRGNLWYDNCTSGCSNSGLTTVANHGVGGGAGHGDSNWADSSKFEVWDFRKGDIARAMFYMDVRYSGDVALEADLELTDNTSLISSGARFMGKLSTLCEWHAADPVDSIEQQRNEVVFSFQNNRNPFIDHPEWVSKVFTICDSVGPTDLIFASSFD